MPTFYETDDLTCWSYCVFTEQYEALDADETSNLYDLIWAPEIAPLKDWAMEQFQLTHNCECDALVSAMTNSIDWDKLRSLLKEWSEENICDKCLKFTGDGDDCECEEDEEEEEKERMTRCEKCGDEAVYFRRYKAAPECLFRHCAGCVRPLLSDDPQLASHPDEVTDEWGVKWINNDDGIWVEQKVTDEDEDEEDVDDVDAPNIFPYKKCSVCNERSSCGNYNDLKQWLCEDCLEPETPPTSESDQVDYTTTMVTGIICKRCKNELPPMTMQDHLDGKFNQECPHSETPPMTQADQVDSMNVQGHSHPQETGLATLVISPA
jgi:hypothetical protein